MIRKIVTTVVALCVLAISTGWEHHDLRRGKCCRPPAVVSCHDLQIQPC